MQEFILAATGHRPEQCGGYDNFLKLVDYAIEIIPSYKPTKMISGMALGWDTAVAMACVELKIPFIAAVPFEGQDSIWPEKSRITFRELLREAETVHVVSPGGYEPWKFIERDKWMVDQSHKMLALWNGDEKGGTYQTVKYAQKIKREIYNVWGGWTDKAKEHGFALGV